MHAITSNYVQVAGIQQFLFALSLARSRWNIDDHATILERVIVILKKISIDSISLDEWCELLGRPSQAEDVMTLHELGHRRHARLSTPVF